MFCVWLAAAAGSSAPKFMVNAPVVKRQVPDTVALMVSVALSAIAGAAKLAASSAQRIVFFMVFPFLPDVVDVD